jgi:hypothetical protein
MYQERTVLPWIARIVLLSLISGCNDRAVQIAREAADRQAQQNTAMAELNKEVASGTQKLVAADAQARKEIVGVHRDLQAERSRLDTGWNTLETERRQIAGQRRTESMLVPVTKVIGGLVLIVVLLGFCWYALASARGGDDTDAQLNEILICEILRDQPPLLTASQRPPSLLGRSGPDERPDE